MRKLDEVILGRSSVRDLHDIYFLGLFNILAGIFAHAALHKFNWRSPSAYAIRDVFAEIPRTPGLLLIAVRAVRSEHPPGWTLEVIKDALRPTFRGLAATEAFLSTQLIYRSLPESERDELRAFLSELPPRGPFFNTEHMETLIAIGACEGPQSHTVEEAEAEIQALICAPELPDAPKRAATAWNMTLDFWGRNMEAVINALPEGELLKFLILVACGILPERASHYEVYLLRKLVQANNPSTARALTIWAQSPPPRTPDLYAAEECWLVATIGLRKLGLPLPPPTAHSQASLAWAAFGSCLSSSGINPTYALYDELLSIDPVSVLAEFIRLHSCLRKPLSRSIGGLGAETQNFYLSPGLGSEVSLLDGYEEQICRIICRAFESGFASSEYFVHAVIVHGLLEIMERIANRDVVIWMVRLADDPRCGRQFAVMVHKLRRASPHLFAE